MAWGYLRVSQAISEVMIRYDGDRGGEGNGQILGPKVPPSSVYSMAWLPCGQIDHNRDHVGPNLPLEHVVQDLYRTD